MRQRNRPTCGWDTGAGVKGNFFFFFFFFFFLGGGSLLGACLVKSTVFLTNLQYRGVHKVLHYTSITPQILFEGLGMIAMEDEARE